MRLQNIHKLTFQRGGLERVLSRAHWHTPDGAGLLGSLRVGRVNTFVPTGMEEAC